MRRWEYRQEKFTESGVEEKFRPPWQSRMEWPAGEAEPREVAAMTEVEWLNRLGAEGWELIGVDDSHVYGRTGGGTFVGGHFAEWHGAIPCKRWLFKREVQG